MLNDKLTASLICMDMSDVKTYVDACLELGINWFHADFMDNTFVPRLGISPELIQFLRKRYGNYISIDSHLMVQNPMGCVDVIAPFSDWVFIHSESVSDPVRVIQHLNNNFPELKVGLAYNLGTAISTRLYNLEILDGIMFMGISPGVLGTKSWPEAVRSRILDFRMMDAPTAFTEVFVDGGVKFSSINNLISDSTCLFGKIHGADKLVCGNSTLFNTCEENKDLPIKEKIKFNLDKMKELAGEK